MKRVIVCGGRDYGRIIAGKTFEFGRRMAERKTLKETLNDLHIRIGAFQLIHGGAKGADSLSQEWWEGRKDYSLIVLPDPIVFPALWDDLTAPGAVVKIRKSGPSKGTSYNAAAGPIRNAKMLTEGKPDLIVAFPGGSGTKDMVDRAKAAGVEVMEIK